MNTPRCEQHKAYEADNCPRCGTAAVIPSTPRPVPNLGDSQGSVAPGDVVICGGEYAPVIRVIVHPIGQKPAAAPIRGDMLCVEVVTARGSRFLGAHAARIAADLRVVWSR